MIEKFNTLTVSAPACYAEIYPDAERAIWMRSRDSELTYIKWKKYLLLVLRRIGFSNCKNVYNWN